MYAPDVSFITFPCKNSLQKPSRGETGMCRDKGTWFPCGISSSRDEGYPDLSAPPIARLETEQASHF